MCYGGELVEFACSDDACREAGLGSMIGCGIADDGATSCLCAER
jgi:hypothetical protein